MIEAVSAGTPLIAWRHGPTLEVIDDGNSGFIVNSIDEAVSAASRVRDLSRERVRHCFEARFTSTRMATDCVAGYERFFQVLFA
jgi:glycosyltransferase involved in cell wall biosynthesis